MPLARFSEVPDSAPERERLWRGVEPHGDWMLDGYSVIVDPNGTVLAGPLVREEGILYATLDLDAARARKRLFDPVGHYNRPDVFRLVLRGHDERDPRWRARQRLTCASVGKQLGMGRVWGPGGWIGPGSWLQRWTFGRWWHFPLLLAMAAAAGWFVVVYFGLFGVGERSRHRIAPSLFGALVYGAVFGLAMLGLKWWEQRSAERQR